MEYYWTTLFNNSNASSTTARGHNGNFTHNHAWGDSSWDLATSNSAAAAAARPDLLYYSPPPPAAAAQAESSAFHAVMLHQQEKTGGGGHSCPSTITSPAVCGNPDPHLTCLKLGKRHYFGDLTPPPLAADMGPFSATKKGKAGTSTAAAAAPTCQVEGCEAVLVNAKEYHRRHKVCEMHAKASKVVLLGIEQRFCQQCSRFHAVGEFDEAKRSCRRRLAGHNERRRKSSQEHNSLARKHYQDIKMMGVVGKHPQPHLPNNGDCALSLLSPTNYGAWSNSPSPDLPARCSAALRELIAENRASLFACRQLINANANQLGPGWAASAAPEHRGHVTLNLMQGPDSAFGLISGHDHRSSEEDGGGECSELWKLPLGY